MAVKYSATLTKKCGVWTGNDEGSCGPARSFAVRPAPLEHLLDGGRVSRKGDGHLEACSCG